MPRNSRRLGTDRRPVCIFWGFNIIASILIQFAIKTRATGRPIPASPLQQLGSGLWPSFWIRTSSPSADFFCTGIRTGPCSKVAKQVAAWVVLGNVPWHKMGGCLEKRTLKAHLIAISQLSAHVFLIGWNHQSEERCATCKTSRACFSLACGVRKPLRI